MEKHKIYCCIVKAINEGKLKEPFSNQDFENVCANQFATDTYKVFLNKHRVSNGNTTELFIKHDDGTYSVIDTNIYDCKKEKKNEN